MVQLMVRTIGFRQAERALALGTLYPPSEALSAGVVDDVVTEQSFSSNDILQTLIPVAIQNQTDNAVMQRAFVEAARYAKIPPLARVATKLRTREESLKQMEATREADVKGFCGFVTHDEVQKNIMRYVEGLKQKNKAKE